MNTGNTKENINLLKEYERLKAENERLVKGIEELKMHLIDILEEANYPYVFELIDNLLNPEI